MKSNIPKIPNTTNTPSTRFFIGLELPAAISSLIDHWRARWYPYGLKVVPPHITIVPPFQANSEDDRLWQQITQPLTLPDTLTVHFNNFGAFFHSACVFFVRVEDSPLLESVHCQLEFRLVNALPTFNKSNRPFHPHVTIANRLKPYQLHEIQQELQHQPLNDVVRVKEATVFQKIPAGAYQKFAVISLDK